MVVITLIGEHQAKEGVQFVYRGPLTECRECKLKAVCFNLDPGGMYRIKKVRDVHHECKIHEEGVRVVQVEKIPVKCAIVRRQAMEGSTITFEDIKCKTLGCANYRTCHPLGLERNMKCKVTSVSKELLCPEGFRLIEVVLE